MIRKWRNETRKPKEALESQAVKTELEARTLEFSLAVIRFVAGFPRSPVGDVVGRQFLKSATAIGANYREANELLAIITTINRKAKHR